MKTGRGAKGLKPVACSKEVEIVAKTQSPPADATHWSCRRMAAVCGVSKTTVQRIWQADGLREIATQSADGRRHTGRGDLFDNE
jgi:hypothetical protein